MIPWGAVWGFVRATWPIWLALALVVAGSLWLVHFGEARFKAGAAATEAGYAARIAAIVPKQQAISERVVTKYVDRVQTVYKTGATITKEIPVYVPVDSCPLPGGFRVLHDAAARGEIPDPAGIAHAAPVDARDLAGTIVDNYTSCHADAERLIALQAWVREQEKLTR